MRTAFVAETDGHIARRVEPHFQASKTRIRLFFWPRGRSNDQWPVPARNHQQQAYCH